MRSQGSKSGFEAFLKRPGAKETRFNEHAVRHDVDEQGVTVTECWLECEDDAVFEIVMRKTSGASGKIITSDWRARVWIDGQRLNHSPWPADFPRQKVWSTVTQQDPERPDMERAGSLQFKRPITTSEEAPDGDNSRNSGEGPSGTIRITLDHGRLTPLSIKSLNRAWNNPGPIPETKVKLASTVGCTFGPPVPRRDTNVNAFHPAERDTWHTFVFKYRHRVALEISGIIGPAPQKVPRRLAENDHDVQEVFDGARDSAPPEDVKPLAVSRTQQQAARIRKLEDELRAERRRNERATKRAKVIDLSLDDD